MRTTSLIRLLDDWLADPNLVIIPGPQDPDVPGRFIKITPGAGFGLNTEGLFEQREYTVEVAGNQEDFDSAETLATDVDRFFLRFIRQVVDGTVVQAFDRGGGFDSLLIDDSRRWHLVCSYTANIQSALTA